MFHSWNTPQNNFQILSWVLFRLNWKLISYLVLFNFHVSFFSSKAWRKIANDNVQGGGECVQEKDRCPSEKSCFWDLLWWQKRRRRRSSLCPIQIATTSIKSIVIYICSICKKLFSSLSLPHILGTFWHFFFVKIMEKF